MEAQIRLDKHKWCSGNKLRSAQKWGSQNLKTHYDGIYSPLIKSLKIPKFEVKVDITVYYNSRLDPDNVSGKFFLDSLVSCGVIKDDSKRFIGRWVVEPVLELKTDTYIVVIKEYTNGNQEAIDFGCDAKTDKRKAK